MVEVILAEQVKATTRLLDQQGKLPPKPEGLENILDHLLPYQVRPPWGSIELLFPIDADTVLRGHTGLRRVGPRNLRHVTLTERHEAKRNNRFVARFGYRLVFSRDRTHEALIVKHAGTSPVIETIAVPSPTGKGSVAVNGCVFGPRPNKPKWSV
jgi:hypothetical protein